MSFNLTRPGTVYQVAYAPATGDTRVRDNHAGFMGMLNRLRHVNGLWHDYWLVNVWGVMVAFSDVAVQDSATIKTLAPGVSAALLTTIAGLVVAIPSVFGYNFLLGKSKQLVTELENYASSLADRIELESK